MTSIGERAFLVCSGLTSITIPNSVTSIGVSAFLGCSSLTSVTIPNNVTSIGVGAFSGCHGLTSIIVESGNAVYDSRDNCNAIIETVTNTLVVGCKNTIIPNSVTSIGYGAFYNCRLLTSITIPNSVTSIGESAFSYCSDLTSVTIPNSVASIGESAFYRCSGLTSVTIPNSVASIGDYAFLGCSGLKTVVNLSNLTISKGSSTNGYAGYYADKVINAPNGELDDGFVFVGVKLCGYIGEKSEITLPQNYKGGNYYIGNSAFKDYNNLTKLQSPIALQVLERVRSRIAAALQA